MTKNNNSPSVNRFSIGQDWASVVAGFVLILFVVITGYAIATPSSEEKPDGTVIMISQGCSELHHSGPQFFLPW